MAGYTAPGGQGWAGIMPAPGTMTIGPTPGPAPPQSAPTYNGVPLTNAEQFMAAQRAPELSWLKSHPAQMNALERLGISEVGGQGAQARQAFMEEELNRALAGRQGPNGGYNFFNHLLTHGGPPQSEFAIGNAIGGLTPGALPPLGQVQNRNMMNALDAAALGGSNISDLATGNFSGARNPGGGPTPHLHNFGDEKFFREQWGGFHPWYNEMTQGMQNYVPGGLGPGAPTGGNFANLGGPAPQPYNAPTPYLNYGAFGTGLGGFTVPQGSYYSPYSGMINGGPSVPLGGLGGPITGPIDPNQSTFGSFSAPQPTFGPINYTSPQPTFSPIPQSYTPVFTGV